MALWRGVHSGIYWGVSCQVPAARVVAWAAGIDMDVAALFADGRRQKEEAHGCKTLSNMCVLIIIEPMLKVCLN